MRSPFPPAAGLATLVTSRNAVVLHCYLVTTPTLGTRMWLPPRDTDVTSPDDTVPEAR
jgi:hypothetical protein